MFVLLILSWIGLSVRISVAQNYCQWYNWAEGDFPDGSTQNFYALLASQGNGDQYLNSSDFDESGAFYGETWQRVFWSGVVFENNTAYYRPYGFRYGYFGSYNNPTACLLVSGIQGYKLELMIYSLNKNDDICIDDIDTDKYNPQDSPAFETVCNKQYVYKCFDAPTDKSFLSIAVYCKNGCSGSDRQNTHFLWRFRRSPVAWEDEKEFASDSIEYWCSNIISSQIEWPNEIGQALPNIYYPNDNYDMNNS